LLNVEGLRLVCEVGSRVGIEGWDRGLRAEGSGSQAGLRGGILSQIECVALSCVTNTPTPHLHKKRLASSAYLGGSRTHPKSGTSTPAKSCSDFHSTFNKPSDRALSRISRAPSTSPGRFGGRVDASDLRANNSLGPACSKKTSSIAVICTM
jgi:hypothetical protein